MRATPPNFRNIGPPQGCRLSAMRKGRFAVVRPTRSLEEIYPMKSGDVPDSTRPSIPSVDAGKQSMQLIHDSRDAFAHRRMEQVVELGHELTFPDEGGLRAGGLGFGYNVHVEARLFGGVRGESGEVGGRGEV